MARIECVPNIGEPCSTKDFISHLIIMVSVVVTKKCQPSNRRENVVLKRCRDSCTVLKSNLVYRVWCSASINALSFDSVRRGLLSL